MMGGGIVSGELSVVISWYGSWVDRVSGGGMLIVECPQGWARLIPVVITCC